MKKNSGKLFIESEKRKIEIAHVSKMHDDSRSQFHLFDALHKMFSFPWMIKNQFGCCAVGNNKNHTDDLRAIYDASNIIQKERERRNDHNHRCHRCCCCFSLSLPLSPICFFPFHFISHCPSMHCYIIVKNQWACTHFGEQI